MNRAISIILHLLFAFAIATHIYVFYMLFNEPTKTTYLPDHEQSAICGE
jgi:hypothetical protein